MEQELELSRMKFHNVIPDFIFEITTKYLIGMGYKLFVEVLDKITQNILTFEWVLPSGSLLYC